MIWEGDKLMYSGVSYDAAYMGETLVWKPYITDYLTIEIVSAGTFTWSKTSGAPSSARLSHIDYTHPSDPDYWISVSGSISINVQPGDVMKFRQSSDYSEVHSNEYEYSSFGGTSHFNVYGNILSLFYRTNFGSQTEFPSVWTSGTATNGGLFRNSNVEDASRLQLIPRTFNGVSGVYRNMFNNCQYLTAAPNLQALTLSPYCYDYMFSGCTSLQNAPTLAAKTMSTGSYRGMFCDCTSLTDSPSLPATTLAEGCYNGMFQGCTALTKGPGSLPAMDTAPYCYNNMFYGCTSLETAAILPATGLTDYCYNSMYGGCTALINSPVLNVTSTTAESCYAGMFKGCSSLAAIKCYLYPDTSLYQTHQWLDNVAASGRFTKSANATWPSGGSGIPTGWTVIPVS